MPRYTLSITIPPTLTGNTQGPRPSTALKPPRSSMTKSASEVMTSVDSRKGHSSPRPKGRENAKNVLCRNLTIYGSCRAQNNGCPYSHEVTRNEVQNDNSRRFLNVDSPSFTPLTPASTNTSTKQIGISPKAVAAAIFTPKAGNTPTVIQKPHPSLASSDFNNEAKNFTEFVPQAFSEFQPEQSQNFNPYAVNGQTADVVEGISQLNPYAHENQGSMFPTSAYSHVQPLNYHLYAPIGPHRENLLPYQRTAFDFFIPDHLREDLQRKTEATAQTFSGSTLPQQIEHFHSLVALDTTAQRISSTYGYPSWLYKAVSSKDGYTYSLRRLENFRLTDEKAIRSVQKWKRVTNGNCVVVHDAFTTRAFGDSSLIIVTDYHPLSQTLAERYLSTSGRHPNSRITTTIPEHELWGLIVQIASALKAIHSAGLACRLLTPQKVIITSKNRIRLNACGILDITQWEQQTSEAELQRDDLVQFGKLILGLATRSSVTTQASPKVLDTVSRSYGQRMADTITWLMTPPGNAVSAELSGERSIDNFLSQISDLVLSSFDAALHEADSLTSNLAREIENARLVRLMTKFNMVLERPESSPAGTQPPQGPASLNQANNSWSETGERYYLKLFRDYVFHQVDADGRPMMDLGRILTALNKLDAGTEEKIQLVSRDEQNCFIVSYREIKRALDGAWNELSKHHSTGRR